MERISKGVLVGTGEGSGKGMMFVSMGYKGKFEFVKNNNYEITISLDLGKVSSYQPGGASTCGVEMPVSRLPQRILLSQ